MIRSNALMLTASAIRFTMEDPLRRALHGADLTLIRKTTNLPALHPPCRFGAGCEAAERRPLLFRSMNKTCVYIDGFNLYYGSLRKTPHRWLDLEQLCRLMLPPNEVQRINYYTARVGARLGDPEQPIRQQAYLRALGTLPTVRVHFGHYLSHPVWMPLHRPAPGGPRYARVIKTEEKGSDVNLATHLVRDAYENAFDCAVLITNDSDLREPVDLVRNRLGKLVGVLNPQKYPAVVLTKVATFIKTIRPGVLQASQFPDEITDARGTFAKPASW